MTLFTRPTLTPLHEHDCDACLFCGNYIDKHKLIFDLYYCPKQENLIARYEIDGDYICRRREDHERFNLVNNRDDCPISFLYNLLHSRGMFKEQKKTDTFLDTTQKMLDELSK